MDADGPSLRRVVMELAVQEATGRLLVADDEGTYGWVWLREGNITGASGPGPRPLLANRLRAFGVLTPQRIRKAMAEAAEQPGRILLDVVSDLVPAQFLAAFLELAVAEQLAFVEQLGASRVRFLNGEVMPSGRSVMRAASILDLAAQMRLTPDTISESDSFVHETADETLETTLQQVVVRACDGNRNLQQIANLAGLTRHEAIVTVEQLLAQGQLSIPDTTAPGPWEVQQPFPDASADQSETGPPAVAPTVSERTPDQLMTPTEREDQETADQDETGPKAPEELQEAVADMLATAPDEQPEDSSDADEGGGEHPEPPKQSEIPQSTRPAPASEPRTQPDPATTRPPKPGRRRRVDPGERRSALSELSALGEDSAEQDVSRDPEPEEHGTADAPEEPQVAEKKNEHETQPTRDPRAASDLMRQLRELSATEESEDQ